jgi:hypothetical protein
VEPFDKNLSRRKKKDHDASLYMELGDEADLVLPARKSTIRPSGGDNSVSDHVDDMMKLGADDSAYGSREHSQVLGERRATNSYMDKMNSGGGRPNAANGRKDSMNSDKPHSTTSSVEAKRDGVLQSQNYIGQVKSVHKDAFTNEFDQDMDKIIYPTTQIPGGPIVTIIN